MIQSPSLPTTRPSSPGQGTADDDIAAIFDDIADLLELQDANPFRIRAYRNAARTLRALTFDLAKIIARDEPFTKLSGVGVDLAGKIKEIDILVCAAPGVDVSTPFIKHPDISTVLVQGPSRTSVLLLSGLQVDVRVIEPPVYGAALVYWVAA